MLSTQQVDDRERDLFIYSIYDIVTLKLLCKKSINSNL